MRILKAHNRYQQPGGEDTTFERETALLTQHGHEVITYERDNAEIATYSRWQHIGLAASTLWSFESTRQLSVLIQRNRPDVAHFHNTFPLISPAAYHTCQRLGVPVVQSLDNPRLICPAATFYRDGQLCQDCLGKTPPWPGVVHACYRHSRSQTAVVAGMLTLHRWIKTWLSQVTRFVASTEFYRQQFIQGGLPAGKISVKPHFVTPDPGLRDKYPGDYALYIGRLEPAKGIATLLEAWRELPDIVLKIRGGGPVREALEATVRKHHLSQVQLVERLSTQALFELIKGARALIWPSEGYYETFGLVAVEAFACGVPVIASRVGVNAEIVDDHRTGLHFEPGNSQDLAQKVRWLFEHPQQAIRLGKAARAVYEAKYTPERNYRLLMGIYHQVIRQGQIG